MIATAEQLELPPRDAATSSARVLCSHCHLPVPDGLINSGAARQFCCHGCETVYAVINSCGLEAYYRLRERGDAANSAAPAKTTGRGYTQFDDPAFHALYVKPAPGGLLETELYLEGVHCAACVWLVEKLPAVVAGVVESRLDFRRATVRIVWDPTQARLSAAARALDSLGYPPHPAKDVSAREMRQLEDRRYMIRIAIAGAAAGNVMLLAFALYAGHYAGIEPIYSSVFRWLSAAIGVLALAWPGSVFFRGAWAAIKTRTAHLDLPISLGLGAGGLWGAINTIRGSGEIYFDSLTVLVFLLLVARWIQHRQQRRAADSIELLYSLTPSSARRIENGRAVEIPIEALRAGDIVEVRTGDSIPVDGIITRGHSKVDQSLLTGESRPIDVTAGDTVAAGAVNLTGILHVRVEATGQETRVGRLMQMVSQCAARRAPIVLLADRLAVYFLFTVITLSAVTLAIWAPTSWNLGMDYAIAMLIVTCPCALSLATPLAMTIAIGRAARRGILIKGADALEKLTRPGTLFLDKTGTITAGQTAVVAWHGDTSIQPLIAALESASNHPIAQALVAAYSDTRQHRIHATNTIGGGIAGTVDGIEVAAGSPAFIEKLGIHIPENFHQHIAETAAHAITPVVIACRGRVAAIAGLGDPIRPDSAAAIDALQQRGWHVQMLSGDHPQVVAAVEQQLCLTGGRGGMSPEDKLHAVEAAAQHGPVVMVGDGVNDAAALSAATVGIAVHGGAEASLAAADVYLSRPGLAPMVELAEASRRTLRGIKLCIAVSLSYNAFAAAMTLSGSITPIMAAVIMPASSFTVLALVYRIKTFGDRPCR
jgi:P-type Cu2+ transporter